MTPEEQIQFNKISEWYESMQNANTIQTPTDQAIRGRFFNGSGLSISSKSASSEDQAVDEGGTDMYDVLKPPDAFLQVTINGQVIYIPVFT